MQFRKTLLASAILAVVANCACAENVSFKTQEDINQYFSKDTSASYINDNGKDWVIKASEPTLNFSGNGEIDVTFKGKGQKWVEGEGGNGYAAFNFHEASDGVSFSNLNSLTFDSVDEQTVSLVVAQGGMKFGTAEGGKIGTLTIGNVNFGNWGSSSGSRPEVSILFVVPFFDEIWI